MKKILNSHVLASVLKNTRVVKGIRQTTLTELAGLRQATISKFENNPEHSELQTLFRIVKALGLNLYISDEKTESFPHTAEWHEEW